MMYGIHRGPNIFTTLVLCISVVLLSTTVLGLSDKRLCADPNCREIISMGIAKINYAAGEKGMLSFKINSPIRIMSKGAGSDQRLWGIEVSGRRGYAPKDFILEQKVLISEKNLKHVVDVSDVAQQAVPVLNASENVAPQEKMEVESTTTVPLELPLKGEELPIVTDAGVVGSVEPQQASPVQQKMEIIDGTELPVSEELPSPIEEKPRVVEEKLDTVVPVVVEEKPQAVVPTLADKPVVVEQKLDTVAPIVVDQKLDTVAPTLAEKRRKLMEQLNAIDDEDEGDYDDEDDFDMSEQINGDYGRMEAKAQPVVLQENVESTVDANPHIKPNYDILVEERNFGVVETKLDNADVKKEEEKKVGVEATTTYIHSNVLNPDEIIPNVQPTEQIEKLVEDVEKVEVVEPLQPEIIKEQKTENEEVKPIADEVKPIQDAPSNLEEVKPSLDQVKAEDHISNLNSVEVPINEEVKLEAVNDVEGSNEIVTNDVIQENLVKELNDEPLTQQFDATIPIPALNVPAASISEEVKPLDNNVVTNPQPEAEKANATNTLDHEMVQLEVIPEESRNPVEASLVETFDKPQEPLPVAAAEEPLPNPESSTVQPQITESGFHSPGDLYDLDAFDTTTETPKIESTTQVPEMLNPVVPDKPTSNEAQEQIPNDYREHEVVDLPPLATEAPFVPYYQQAQVPSLIDEQHNHEIERNPNDYYGKQEQVHEPPKYPPPTKPSWLNEPPFTAGAQQEAQKSSQETDEERNVEQAASVESDMPIEVGIGSVETLQPIATPVEASALPTTTSQPEVEDERKEPGNGLFATILGTVNSFLSSDKKETLKAPSAQSLEDEELERILFPERRVAAASGNKPAEEKDEQYCEKLSGNNCPSGSQTSPPADCNCDLASTITMDNFVEVFAGKVVEMSEMLACLAIAAASSLLFIFGYYCFCNSSREGALLSKLNLLERSLLASHKENAILKHDLMQTRHKLSSIEDNSFGSNDMVISLKKELEEEIFEKERLQEQVNNLEKELENAAEAGLELNKIVSELLSNQTGDESIISSVEELQIQLNEQQNTILEINSNLAEKSRENSELQLMLAEQNSQLGGEIASLQQDNDELEAEKNNLQSRLQEIKGEFDEDISKALEGKNFEIKRLQNEIMDLKGKWEHEHTKWQTSLAKVEALEDCLKHVKRDPSVNIKEVIDVANIRAELLDMEKKRSLLKERLDSESDARKLVDNNYQIAIVEVEKLKQDFHQSEKDKLEAQTRLEVLSNYFKEKETQLQKELSLKEAMWLKQQGETTSTVDRLTTMQDEIQSLKSQNDALRAEIEAQLAAHKAQTGTLENRAHENWLTAKQSERRYEESRAEASALRRKLTALAGGNPNEANRAPLATADGKINTDLNKAASPIHMEPPGSPLLGQLPPPPFLPPPFMGPPPPFMGMPPRFLPPSEMRHMRSGRYSPKHADYDDFYDDEDDDDELVHHRRRSGGGGPSGNWHRDTYSPPRTYRSQSPTTERDLMSTYDTETDFSPPPSPRQERRGRGGGYKAYSPHPPQAVSPPLRENNSRNISSSANKGGQTSGSEKSSKSSHHYKKGKSMV